MDLPNLVVLDVGHGNCAVLSDTKGVTIIDAGQKDTLLEFLEHSKITEISAILISHVDDDHIAGVPSLLLAEDITVREVYINPNSGKRGRHWTILRSALKYAKKETRIKTQLTTENSTLNFGSVDIEVLAPEPEDAVSGPEGVDLEGKKLTSNAMSAVIRLVKDGKPLVILPGDIENRSIETWLSGNAEAKAAVLVFPHHGGTLHPANTSKIVKCLCENIQPEYVIFSIGRGKNNTPREEVVEVIRSELPKVRILCTQLSDLCATKVPGDIPDHLNDIPAAGLNTNSCCAGSIIIDLSKSELDVKPNEKDHRAFSVIAAPDSLCFGDN
jgi:competence protein ComEC